MIGFGVLSAVQLPKESNPEISVPVAFVSTPFPGASVEEVEELVTNKIEDKISSLDDVEVTRSNSRSGISNITIEFDPNADATEVLADLKDAVDEAKPDLPDNAEDPIVKQVSFDDEPILLLSLAGPYDTAQLKVYAEELKREIERIGNVQDVEIFGGKEREVQVIVDKARLDTFGLPLSAVTQAISQANSDIPIGSIETGGEDYNLRFAGRLSDPKQIEQVPIGSAGGVPVTVSDVALVRDTFSQPGSYSFMSSNGGSIDPAVTLRIFKSPGGDITKLSDSIQQKAAAMAADSFPENVTIEATQDVAQYIKDDLGSLTRNGIATVIIVILLLILFIGWREALMAGFSIPLAFLTSFIGLLALGMTINFMTLFSLILALGILVDSAIVINQGLHKHRKDGKSARQAAIDTIREFQFPLITGTLTTVFAFVPMLLTGGIVGEFIKGIPVTVTLVLVSSLFIALAIVTTVSSQVFKKPTGNGNARKLLVRRAFDSLKGWYKTSLRRLLERKKSRSKLKRVLLLLFIITYALPGTGLLKVEMFPSGDIDFFAIDLEKPFGTPLEETRDAIIPIAEEIHKDPRFKSIVVNVGSTLNLEGQGGASGAHLAHILVNLADERDEKSPEIVAEYREKFASFNDGTLTVAQQGSGPPGSAPVEIKIAGDDLTELDALSAEFEKLLAGVDGTTNVRNSVVDTNGQFAIHVDRLRAEQYGIDATQLAFTLRNAINGADATEITLDGDDVDVVVKYALNREALTGDVDTAITDITTIEALTISTPGGEVPVSSVADIRLENSRAGIEHEDGERIVRVNAGTDAETSPLEVFAVVSEQMDQQINVPPGYAVTLGGENEDTQESFADMLRAMILAIILIAGLMVLQFRSYKQALLIVITIPFALIGVFPGLLLMNQPISFPGVIGIVALAGIVVNNAIILIDRINNNRTEGMEIDDAIVEAGNARIEPIILTTITTVFGILPLALTQPIWASLGYAIIYGLLFSTVTTLVVIPLLYKRLMRKKPDRLLDKEKNF